MSIVRRVAPLAAAAAAIGLVAVPTAAQEAGVRPAPRPAATLEPPARAPSAQPPASVTLTRDRLAHLLGDAPRADSSGLRVVRAGGVTDLAAAAPAVRLAPGEFVFRKMGDSAHRVGATADGPTAPPPAERPAPSGGTGVEPSPPPPPPPPPPRTVAPVVPGAVTYAMPYRWLTVDSAGVERLLAPYFVLLGGGLTYDVRARLYRGVALVGVEDTLDPDAGTVPLARPLRLQLATTDGGTVAPAQLAIAHTSLDYDSVRIEAPDPTQVRIRTGADPAGIVVPIPVRALAVALTPHQGRLEAFGLATTEISVALPRGLARDDTAVVELRATSSPVRPGLVRVAGSAPGVVRLRSGAPGADTIHAYIDGVPAGSTVVTFAAPWTFLGAAGAGIVLGGLLRWAGAKRRKRLKALSWDVAKGAPAGLLAAAAGAIGLDLLGLGLDEPGTAIAVLVTAALGAAVGSRIVDRVTGAGAAATR